MPFYQEARRLIKIIHFPLNNDKLIAGPKNVLRNCALPLSKKGNKPAKRFFAVKLCEIIILREITNVLWGTTAGYLNGWIFLRVFMKDLWKFIGKMCKVS